MFGTLVAQHPNVLGLADDVDETDAVVETLANDGLEFGDLQVVGSSPEALVKLNGPTASLRPIAGTLPRGATRDEDIANVAAFLASDYAGFVNGVVISVEYPFRRETSAARASAFSVIS